MQKTASEIKAGLKSEYNYLTERIKELEDVSNSDSFPRLRLPERQLILIQLDSMRAYLGCLKARIKVIP